MPQNPDAAAGHDRAGAYGRGMAVGIAAVEALVFAAGAVVALLSGARGGSLVLGLAVAAFSAALAYLMVEVARGFAARRRWPFGIFVTVQLLTVLVALSVGSPALLSLLANPRIGGLTLLALLVAATGLVAVWLLSRAGRDGSSPPEAG